MKHTGNSGCGRRFHERKFLLGVNYWPRKSGVGMWRNFDEDEIDSEFAQIHALGMDTVRVFPLWDDFQPIYELPGAGNIPRTIGMRHNWNITPEINPEMMDEDMFRKFDKVVELAGKHQLKLIVALLTAWMSGTLFNPTWKNGRNFFHDSFMLKYQMLYCRAFAARYAGRPEILAWEYGNEQNCTDQCASPETAWVWLHALAGELRLHDPETSIGSGMHGLHHIVSAQAPWGIADNADAVDFLTTHPYPAFTPGCFKDTLTSVRANLHATAESRYLADLGRRPTLCEETGSLGNSILSEPLSAAYLRMRLYSLFANGLAGCLWWCYSDFLCGDELPYRDVQMENDGLGLTRTDSTPKPVALEMLKFRSVVDRFDGHLPELKRQAAILVSDLNDDWLSVFNCFVLCIQAGFAPAIVRPGYEDLSQYRLLLAPSLSGMAPLSSIAWNAVQKALQDGSILYVSGDGACLTGADRLFGISEMEQFPLSEGREHVRFDCGFEYDIQAVFGTRIHHFDAEVIAVASTGEPVMLKHACGAGTAYFLSLPLEKSLAEMPNAAEKIPAWKLYRLFRDAADLALPVDFDDPQCERYWNSDVPGHGYLSVINHHRETIEGELLFRQAYKTVVPVAGEAQLSGKHLILPPLQAAILEVSF